MPASPHVPKTPTFPLKRRGTTNRYLVGFVLASVLTAIPFGLVAASAMRPRQIFIVIGAAAITQLIVHLRYFLHIDLNRSSQNKLIALCFSILLLILVGGTLWIMFELNNRVIETSASFSLQRLQVRIDKNRKREEAFKPFQSLYDAQLNNESSGLGFDNGTQHCVLTSWRHYWKACAWPP